jgi:hypothetical protein
MKPWGDKVRDRVESGGCVLVSGADRELLKITGFGQTTVQKNLWEHLIRLEPEAGAEPEPVPDGQ